VKGKTKSGYLFLNRNGMLAIPLQLASSPVNEYTRSRELNAPTMRPSSNLIPLQPGLQARKEEENILKKGPPDQNKSKSRICGIPLRMRRAVGALLE